MSRRQGERRFLAAGGDCPECGGETVLLLEAIFHCTGCGRLRQRDSSAAKGRQWVDWTKEGLELLAGFTEDGRAKTVLLAGGREALRLSACIARSFLRREAEWPA